MDKLSAFNLEKENYINIYFMNLKHTVRSNGNVT